MERDDVATDDVVLHSGKDLSIPEANEVCRSTRTRVVVLAGMEDSGKTTILTSLYEAFRRGIVRHLQFAGSLTLVGFEQRCHHSRIRSGNPVPITDRTRQGPPRFLNIAVVSEGSTEKLEVLFTDISGEVYRAARDYEDDALSLRFVRRADHFAVVLDGARLSNPAQRAGAINDARGILKRFIGNGMLGARSLIEIVTSKLDLIESDASAGAILAYLNGAEQRLMSEFGTRVGGISVFRVAARPVSGVRPEGFNVPELFEHWVEESLRYSPRTEESPRSISGSPFDSFQARGPR